MSDPKIDFQQLLSDHLDGWLTGKDLETLERQLRSDADLRHQYETMLADRESLRALLSQPPAKSLPADFARSVTAQAARRRNEVDGLNTPVTAMGDRHRWRRRIVIASVIVTAATLLLVISSPTGDGVSPNQLTSNGVPPTTHTESFANEDPEPADSKRITPDRADLVPMERLADAQVVTDSPRTPVESDSMRAATEQPIAAPNADERIAAMKTPDASSVAQSGPRQTTDVSSAVAMSQTPDDTFSGAVLVYDVRLTSRGRVTQPLSLAMQQVGLAETTRQPIDRSLIEAAKGVETFDPESKFKVLYLRASAKRLDRLFETLLRDSDNVNSVALSLVTDSPILKLTDNLERVDATLIQREDRFDAGQRAASYQLESDQGSELAVLRRLLDDQTFIPMTPGLTGFPRTGDSDEVTAADGRSDLESVSDRDIMSRVLVIIR